MQELISSTPAVSSSGETSFSFCGQPVRVKIIEKEPFFCLLDVCKVLGIVNIGVCKSRLSEKGVCNTDTLTKGGIQQTTFINESNLYKVIFRSRKKEAEKFTEWVTSDVLPSIRKHGGYLTPEKVEEALLDPDVIIRLATELKKEREKRLEAEKTKAHISDRKTATALATASAAVRQLNKIKDEIGNGRNYKRVTCIYWIPKYFHNNYGAWVAIGKYLMNLSAEMGKNPIYVPDERFGQVRAYHISVLEYFHELIKNDDPPMILTPYRKKFVCE